MKNITKTEWLFIFLILKRKKDSIDTNFIWFNPLTYIYFMVYFRKRRQNEDR